jgi:lysophospholipase L1-like esterase
MRGWIGGGLTVLAMAVLLGLAINSGAQRQQPPTREQRMDAGFAAIRQAHVQSPLAMVGDSLTARHAWSLGGDCAVPANLAVQGAEIADVLRNFDVVPASGARRALVMLGINDLRHGTAFDTLLADYRKLLSRLQQAGITPVLQSTLPVSPLHVDSPYFNRQVALLNAQLRAWAQVQGWHYLDVQARVELRHYLGDGLHLNDQGYRAWMAVIDAELRAALCRNAQ